MAVVKIPPRPVLVSLAPRDEPGFQHPHRSDLVFVESGNYIVRTLIGADVTDEMVSWFNRDDMLRGLNIGRLNFSLDSLKRFVSGFDNFNNYILGIFEKGVDSPVGFYTIDVNRMHKTGSFTAGIGEASQKGKKTLWATIDAVLDHFYAERDIDKFTAKILSRNFAMLFNFRNNGRFFLEAHLKKECLAPNGKRVDLLVFASHKPDHLS